ncbi:hypothetical protein [uncultured Microbacterium sp.]
MTHETTVVTASLPCVAAAPAPSPRDDARNGGDIDHGRISIRPVG